MNFNPKLSPRRSARFTLVELLVVVAIISLLAGMLLPALQQAYDSARLTQCAANLKQHSVALTQYSGDNGDFLPPTYVSGTYYWKKLLASAYLDVNIDAIKAPCVFTCPNGAAVHAAYRPACFNGYGLNSGMAHRKLTAPRAPSQTLLCADGKWRVAGNFYENALWPDALMNGIPDGVHQGRVNLAYTDCHGTPTWPAKIPTDWSEASGGSVFWSGK